MAHLEKNQTIGSDITSDIRVFSGGLNTLMRGHLRITLRRMTAGDFDDKQTSKNRFEGPLRTGRQDLSPRLRSKFPRGTERSDTSRPLCRGPPVANGVAHTVLTLHLSPLSPKHRERWPAANNTSLKYVIVSLDVNPSSGVPASLFFFFCGCSQTFRIFLLFFFF